jgi:AcrR family transcriptional regulator
MTTKDERRGATRGRLIDAGRHLFGARGFDDVSQVELVRAAGVTRGALYHHFDGKEGLFAAVYAELQQEITARIVEAAGRESNPWRELEAGCMVFLRACLDPEVQRIVLRDAPRVLGWDHWREVDAASGLIVLEEGIRAAIDAGDMRALPPTAVARGLLGAMNELGLWLANAPDATAALGEAELALSGMLDGLRADRDPHR